MPQLKKSRFTLNLGAYAKPQIMVKSNPDPRHQSTLPTQAYQSPNPTPIPKLEAEIPLPVSEFSLYQPPPRPVVERAIPVLEERVNPKRKSGVGHSKSKLTSLALRDLGSVLELFHTYVRKADITWTQASTDVALAKGQGERHARTLRTWGRACLLDASFTPRTSYGQNHYPLIKDDEFRQQLSGYLLSVGKYVTTGDVIQFTAQPDMS